MKTTNITIRFSAMVPATVPIKFPAMVPVKSPVMVRVPVIALLFFCYSCKTIKYIPVETTKTEYRHIIKTDSIHLRDSIIIKQKNDTVFLEKYRYFYRYATIRDSFTIRDTLRVPYPVETVRVKEIKTHLSGLQHFQIWFGRIALIFLLLIFILKLKR